MRALVTGAGGMLASDLLPILHRYGIEVLGIDIRNLGQKIVHGDVRDYQAIARLFQQFCPHLVFHLAAETDVDLCEEKPDVAFEVNATGTAHIVRLCKLNYVPLVYVSTASVFDGTKAEGYLEDDRPHPINAYGKSKLEAERCVLQELRKYLIVRAAWMAGGWKLDKKFVAKVVSVARSGQTVYGATDKRGSLTFTFDLSQNLVELVERRMFGLYHMANHGVATRFALAERILSHLNGQAAVDVRPVTSDFFRLKAPRPDSEVLVNGNLMRLGLDRMPAWESSLESYVKGFAYDSDGRGK